MQPGPGFYLTKVVTCVLLHFKQTSNAINKKKKTIKTKTVPLSRIMVHQTNINNFQNQAIAGCILDNGESLSLNLYLNQTDISLKQALKSFQDYKVSYLSKNSHMYSQKARN